MEQDELSVTVLFTDMEALFEEDLLSELEAQGLDLHIVPEERSGEFLNELGLQVPALIVAWSAAVASVTSTCVWLRNKFKKAVVCNVWKGSVSIRTDSSLPVGTILIVDGDRRVQIHESSAIGPAIRSALSRSQNQLK